MCEQDQKICWNDPVRARNQEIRDEITEAAKLGWPGLSWHPDLTLKDLLANPDFPWKWPIVTKAPQISICDILDTDLPWDWPTVCQYKLTPETLPMMLIKLGEQSACWRGITRNLHFSWTFIHENPQYPWDFDGIHDFRGFTLKDIATFSDRPGFFKNYRECVHVRHAGSVIWYQSYDGKSPALEYWMRFPARIGSELA